MKPPSASTDNITAHLLLSDQKLVTKIARKIKRQHESETQADYREAATRIM